MPNDFDAVDLPEEDRTAVLHYCLHCGVVVVFNLHDIEKHQLAPIDTRACPACHAEGEFLALYQ